MKKKTMEEWKIIMKRWKKRKMNKWKCFHKKNMKNEENEEQWKNEESWKKMQKTNTKSSHICKIFVFIRKIIDDFLGIAVVAIFLNVILVNFHDFCFEMCFFFQEENQHSILEGHRFFPKKWDFLLDVEQKHTF